MGFTIISAEQNGNETDQYVDSIVWSALLLLAHAYGWKPEGTRLDVWTHKDTGEIHYAFIPENINESDGFWGYVKDWGGSYFSNDGQEISATDALNLALALEKALKDLPYNQEIFDAKSMHLESELREKLRKSKIWSMQNQDLINRMIKTFRTGACNIF